MRSSSWRDSPVRRAKQWRRGWSKPRRGWLSMRPWTRWASWRWWDCRTLSETQAADGIADAARAPSAHSPWAAVRGRLAVQDPAGRGDAALVRPSRRYQHGRAGRAAVLRGRGGDLHKLVVAHHRRGTERLCALST